MSKNLVILTQTTVTEEGSGGEQNTNPTEEDSDDSVSLINLNATDPPFCNRMFAGGRLTLDTLDTTVVGNRVFFADDGPTTDLALKSGAKVVPDKSIGGDAGDLNGNEKAASVDVDDIGLASIAGGDLFAQIRSDCKAAFNDMPFELTLAVGACGLMDTATKQADLRGPRTCFWRSSL